MTLTAVTDLGSDADQQVIHKAHPLSRPLAQGQGVVNGCR
jgi:hypothetical protein